MTDTAVRLAGPQALTLSSATLYTVPASTTAVIRSIHVANTGGAEIGLFVAIGSDASATRLFHQKSVFTNDIYSWTGFIVLNTADFITGYATATGLTITISGVQVT